MCSHSTELALPQLCISLQRNEDTPTLPNSASALRALIEQKLPGPRLKRAALQRLATGLNRPPTWLERSLPDWNEAMRERFHAQLVLDDVTALAWQVLTGRDDDPPHVQDEPGRYYRALSTLLDGLPEMRIAIMGPMRDPAAIARLVQLLEDVPGWRWTLEADSHLIAWLDTPPNSHTKDFLRLNLAATRGGQGSSATPPPDRGEMTTATDPASACAVLDLQRKAEAHAVDARLQAARQALDTLPPPPGADRPAVEDAVLRARSLAELALYQLLQSQPATRQLFTLNQRMPFNFGPKPAELDLYSPLLRLCIEVDGPHHFVSAEGYRRDRRKDALLQEHGIWVLRVLAEDVVQRTDEVTNFVLNCVEKRRAKGSQL